jgi:DNA-binding XRE family transcriptional regulator
MESQYREYRYCTQKRKGIDAMRSGIISENQVTANMRLKELRELNQYSSEQLAGHLNIEQSHLEKLEQGNKPFTATLAEQVCNLFGCSKEYLFGVTDVVGDM